MLLNCGTAKVRFIFVTHKVLQEKYNVHIRAKSVFFELNKINKNFYCIGKSATLRTSCMNKFCHLKFISNYNSAVCGFKTIIMECRKKENTYKIMHRPTLLFERYILVDSFLVWWTWQGYIPFVINHKKILVLYQIILRSHTCRISKRHGTQTL